MKKIISILFIVLIFPVLSFAQPYQPPCVNALACHIDYNQPCKYDYLLYKATILNEVVYRVYYCEEGTNYSYYGSLDFKEFKRAHNHILKQRKLKTKEKAIEAFNEAKKRAKWEKVK
ncbi:MAG: hypothetical protein A2031_07945 [Deltaproteobacteria bacterium RBG_19FT_COMBO_43_11]|nr:MAG: hypothetical protein A2W27_08130 [Deltaproteobacteria bacterium RBG_16_44_11]OGP87127.1 MAG: hypothetical protein A2031_07945 [Deltaproteobacteria bacterium RBG_19FT_COMBO_43_11]